MVTSDSWAAEVTSPLLSPLSHSLSQVLAGDDDVYYACDKCKAKTAATVYMRIHRFPRILQLHIKRFKYAGVHDPITACASYGHHLRCVAVISA